MKTKYIIASSHQEAGISNRLKCLISVLRLCKKLKREPILLWMPPTLFMGCKDFSELFTTKIARMNKKEVDNLIKVKKVKICKTYEDCLDKNYDYFLFTDWRFILLPGEVPKGFAKAFPDNEREVIDLEYERTPIKLKKEFSLIVKKLTPTPKINEKINSFFKEHDNFKNVVGLHVRRRDFLINTDGRGKVSTDEIFFKRMKEILDKNPKVKFFLATDSPIPKEKFSKKFPGRIIFFQHDNWDRATAEAIENSLIDLLLLSKTKHILGSFLSSFTEVAWWFGGAKAKVEIIGDEEKKAAVINIQRNPSESKHYSRLFSMMSHAFEFMLFHFFFVRFLWDKYLDYKTKKMDKKSKEDKIYSL